MPTTAHTTTPAAAPETPAAYLAAYEKFDHLASRLRSRHSQRMTHSALEQLLETEGRELLRRLLQAHLVERTPGAVTGAVSDAAGEAHTHQRTREAGVGERFRNGRGHAHGLQRARP